MHKNARKKEKNSIHSTDSQKVFIYSLLLFRILMISSQRKRSREMSLSKALVLDIFGQIVLGNYSREIEEGVFNDSEIGMQTGRGSS